MVPEDFLAVHPQDLTDHGLAEGTEVIVTRSYGSVTVPVKADATVTSGSAWLPESLKETAVGTLLNGNYWEWVTLSRA